MKILAINPSVTYTQIAIFHDYIESLVFTIKHQKDELSQYDSLAAQANFRMKKIVKVLESNEYDINKIEVVSAKGGLLKPLSSGVYRVNEKVIDDLKHAKYGEDEANLGALISAEFAKAKKLNIPLLIANPCSLDEMDELAKISGFPGVSRQSKFHALNQKAVARNYAKTKGCKYEDLNIIVAHMGLGTTVGAHSGGRVIDVNDGLDGDGPFSAERPGKIAVAEVVRMCYSGKYTEKEFLYIINNESGLYGYFRTSSAKDVEDMIKNGDKKAKLLYKAMAYQVAKEIGAMAVALEGKVDGIILTGGIAYSDMICNWIKERVSFISEVVVYPGEDELKALAECSINALKGDVPILEYN